MRELIVLLLVINIIAGLYVVYQNKSTNEISQAINVEKKKTVRLQREHDQLRGEHHSLKGDLEDELIARNQLKMDSPKAIKGVILLQPQPANKYLVN